MSVPELKFYDVIDIEASGFGRGSYPVEIGVCLENGETHCFLIYPQSDWQHWTKEGQQTHGISRERLLKHGHPPQQVAQKLNQLLCGRTIYTDAWGQDHSWLMKLYDAANCWPNYKLESIRSLLDEEQADRYHECFANAEKSLQLTRHRASTDAKLIQQALALTHYGQ